MTEIVQCFGRQHFDAATDSLNYYVGQYTGDIYLTGLDIFFRLTYPRNAGIFFRDDLDYISGGTNPYGDVGV